MLNAIFNDGVETITVNGLTQWDIGQKLRIECADLPDSFQVHFGSKRLEYAYVVEATKGEDNSAIVDIPNILLQRPVDAIAWVYFVGINEGETVRTIHLPLQLRIKPSDYAYTETEVLNYETVIKKAETAAKVATDAVAEIGNGYAPQIETVASGETVAISDSAERPLRGLTVYGKSEQYTTTGKNKLKNTATTQTKNGITFTVNENKSITISGTASADTFLNVDINEPILHKQTDLIVSLEGGNANIGLFIGYFIDDTNHQAITSTDSMTSKTFQFPTGAIKTRHYIKVASGTAANTTVYPMIRLASITDATYEPYTGGIDSPNPDYPQEIVSVANPVVTINGKNLLSLKPKSSTETKGITYTINEDGSVTVNGTATEAVSVTLLAYNNGLNLKNASYILSGCPSGGGTSTYYLNFYDYKAGSSAADKGEGVEVPFENEGGAYSLQLRIASGYTANNLVFKPMIRFASITDSTYEPYKAQSLSILTNGLHGIPVASGGNYTDSSGQQWICDEIDLARGVKVQRVYVLDCAKDSFSVSKHAQSSENFFVANVQTAACNSKSILSTHFESSSGFTKEGIYVYATGNGTRPLHFSISTARGVTTTEEAKQWLIDNGVKVLHVLKNPVEIPLTDEEKADYSVLWTYYPNTAITNDKGAGIALNYVTDTKLYIDNKFAELSAAILGE